MTRLLILTIVAIATAGLTGCNWLNRGPQCNTCAPAVGGSVAGYGGEAYLAPPTVQPGATYLPGPAG